MADHLRKQIRAAAVTTLTGLSTTSTRVYDSRARLIQNADLPCLRVYCDDEAIENVTMGPSRERRREMTLVVEGVLKANTNVDDSADQIAKEVEVALDGNNGLGGLVKWIEPKSIAIEFSGEGETIVAVVKMQFQITYYSAKGAPDVAL